MVLLFLWKAFKLNQIWALVCTLNKKKSVILAKAWICVAFWERPSDINRVHISSSDFFQVAKTCFLLI